MVLLWTALSFSVPSKVPSGVPRRFFSPLPWESESLYHWLVIKLIRKRIVKSAKECIKQKASNSEMYGKMQGYGPILVEDLFFYFCENSLHLVLKDAIDKMLAFDALKGDLSLFILDFFS